LSRAVQCNSDHHIRNQERVARGGWRVNHVLLSTSVIQWSSGFTRIRVGAVEGSGDGDSAAVRAIAGDIRGLTTTHAETTNGPKIDEIISNTLEPSITDVTAVSGELSGLDTGKTNPSFYNWVRAGASGDLTDDRPGEAGTAVGAAGGEAAPADDALRQGDSDGLVGLDGLVGSQVEGSGDRDSAAVRAIADDVDDLTTTHAETTDEAKFDEIISNTLVQSAPDVTAVSGEVSGLDTGKTNPNFYDWVRAGASGDLTDTGRGEAGAAVIAAGGDLTTMGNQIAVELRRAPRKPGMQEGRRVGLRGGGLTERMVGAASAPAGCCFSRIGLFTKRSGLVRGASEGGLPQTG
jgi:hypothetical protein